jgi:diguanylate cyclase (GGDEF)-like protein
LKQQVADADCCIHMSVGCDYLELVPESCSSTDLSLRLSRVPLDARGEICARAAIGARRIVDVQPRPAYSWPVFDANRLVLGTISVFPHSTAVPDTLGEILDLTTQLVSLAINNRRLYDGLTYRSGHDSLTGLPNRVFLDEHLASSLRSAAGPPVRFAIAYIDLDEFKEVNDVYGHTTGDTFLQIAASRFRSVLRNDDLLARIGGDEFIAVLAGVADRREATRRGQRLLESLKCEFAIGDALRLPCTASIGVALFPEDGSSIDDLKRCADESMYVAKTEGKNQVRACNRIGLPKSQLSSAQLRNAINENRLLVHYQPIFLAEGGLSGFEALVRIEDPSGQLVVPDRFIDLAEKSSLIVALGHSVLRQACRQAAVWARDTRASLRMAVNVSARQFARPDFFKDVLSILSEAHLPPKLLELEITEASILKDLEGAIEQLEQLRRHGVLIAIDDFGTGYSTLSLVHRLPLDAIKIDRSFVQSLTLDGAMHAIKAIIALASGLALQSIAEGVENARQLQTLLSLGCTAFQGYGFARPMCASSIEAQLGGWMATVPNVTHRLETAFDSRTDGVSNPDFAILPSGRWLAETHRDRPEVR